jgi:hypothetical protein
MGAHYCLDFQVNVDPQKESMLNAKLDDAGLRENVDYWFERDEEKRNTILCVYINDHMPHSCISAIEKFITNNLKASAISSALIEEEYEGERNVYAIGPDSKTLESEYHRDRIEWHLKFLSSADKDIVQKWVTDHS